MQPEGLLPYAKDLPLVPVLSQMNFHHLPLHFLQIHFNIPSTLRFCKWPVRIFPPEPCVHFSLPPPHSCNILHPSYHSNNYITDALHEFCILHCMKYSQFRKMFQRSPGFVSFTNPLYDDFFFYKRNRLFALYETTSFVYQITEVYLFNIRHIQQTL